ncbi:hypothetical protein HYPSUDRAFT_204023 [Hypholoma sublateritium FD-334 SS-4]|uniref:Uncharacterized protein n=1 Tax=Hypholoma sublateritium (strain FD-334 SS-4) TaxID=945553 RepID=A0A0D2NUA3_HYPSF|nr:hypothetical protein HYPSUDRAFT_204023 [Hypholoma sublateritium FD-334 SS-4]
MLCQPIPVVFAHRLRGCPTRTHSGHISPQNPPKSAPGCPQSTPNAADFEQLSGWACGGFSDRPPRRYVFVPHKATAPPIARASLSARAEGTPATAPDDIPCHPHPAEMQLIGQPNLPPISRRNIRVPEYTLCARRLRTHAHAKVCSDVCTGAQAPILGHNGSQRQSPCLSQETSETPASPRLLCMCQRPDTGLSRSQSSCENENQFRARRDQCALSAADAPWAMYLPAAVIADCGAAARQRSLRPHRSAGRARTPSAVYVAAYVAVTAAQQSDVSEYTAPAPAQKYGAIHVSIPGPQNPDQIPAATQQNAHPIITRY